MKHFLLILVVALSLDLSSRPAFAAELKIIDGAKLLRAESNISKTAQVTVEINAKMGSEPIHLSLSNIDGVLADLEAERGEKLFTFPAVAPGIWLIKSSSPVEILEVKIGEP